METTKINLTNKLKRQEKMNYFLVVIVFLAFGLNLYETYLLYN